MSSRTFLVLIGVLLYVSNSTIAEQASLGDLSKISADVLSVMEGNQANLDSVLTIQSVFTKNSTHSFADKKGYRLVQKHRIIYDGDHFRKDQLETMFTGEKEYKRYAGAVTVGRVDIDSAESNIDYIPSNNMVFIRPPRWSNRYKIRTNDLLKYQSARGATLRENILASAKNGYYFTASCENVEGEECILLTCDYTNPEATLKIWIVPSKGYCIKKVQDISNGKIYNEYQASLKKYSPGNWWFDSVQARRTTDEETVVSRLSVDSLTFNEAIDPDIFTVWGLDITSKTRITDEMQGTTYTLTIDDAKNEAANPIIPSDVLFIAALGILVLVTVNYLRILKKRNEIHGS